MSIIALIAAVFFIAFLIAAWLARNPLKELAQFLKMDNKEKEVASAKMQERNRFRSFRHDKVSGDWNFVFFFFGLSAVCALLGLSYTCGYSAFWGAMILASAIEEQVRIYIANYGNPVEIDGVGVVFEFKAA